ncbi:hypothetical protein ACT3CD_02395 [Geofilum sp. OHC36d9]|uniref:hypothetical protein n=1 Tax=Geofilum sp. OHC36d9 TaxID=3458413 RepID=UPI0040344E67
MTSKLKFKYDLVGTGKAKGLFVIEDTTLSFNTINVCDPLGDLLQAMVSIIQEPSHLWDEENSAVVEWYCDEFILVLDLSSPDGNTIHLNLTQTAVPFGEEMPLRKISGDFELKDFYLTIISELDRLIKQKGLLNYVQLWQKNEFPLTYFLILKKYLINWKIWKPDVIDNDILESEFMMILT